MKKITILLLALTLVLLSGCSSVIKKTYEMKEESWEKTDEIDMENEGFSGVTYSLSSSDSSVAYIDTNNKKHKIIRAEAPGKAKVTVANEDNGKKLAVYTIIVNEKSDEEICEEIKNRLNRLGHEGIYENAEVEIRPGLRYTIYCDKWAQLTNAEMIYEYKRFNTYLLGRGWLDLDGVRVGNDTYRVDTNMHDDFYLKKNGAEIYREEKDSKESKESKEVCPVCGGSGLIKYNYGSSDLEAVLSGHDPYTFSQCYKCLGKGYISK